MFLWRRGLGLRRTLLDDRDVFLRGHHLYSRQEKFFILQS